MNISLILDLNPAFDVLLMMRGRESCQRYLWRLLKHGFNSLTVIKSASSKFRRNKRSRNAFREKCSFIIWELFYCIKCRAVFHHRPKIISIMEAFKSLSIYGLMRFYDSWKAALASNHIVGNFFMLIFHKPRKHFCSFLNHTTMMFNAYFEGTSHRVDWKVNDSTKYFSTKMMN